MGKDLRWQTLESSSTSDSNAASTWTNNTNEDISIRIVHFSGYMTETAAGSTAITSQLSKDDTIQTGDTRTGWHLTNYVSCGVVTSGNASGHGRQNYAYPRGAVLLRANETLNLHIDATGTPDGQQTTYMIGYEFL